jgi:glycerophosphoryl diester phosphodiesterase
VLIIAHRTCPLDAPENSLAGIRKAAELGADGVEVDIRRTLEGAPVLMHDPTPRRTTGLPGPVFLYPKAILQRARLQGTEERVPSLDEAIQALPPGMMLALEIKDASLARSALSAIRSHQLEGRVSMLSYREEAVRYFAKHGPDIEAWLLRDDFKLDGLRFYLDRTEACGANAVSVHWNGVSPGFVADARARGIKVYSMNRSLDDVVEKAKAGLEGIVTDHPLEVRAMLENAGLLPAATASRATAAGA